MLAYKFRWQTRVQMTEHETISTWDDKYASRYKYVLLFWLQGIMDKWHAFRWTNVRQGSGGHSVHIWTKTNTNIPQIPYIDTSICLDKFAHSNTNIRVHLDAKYKHAFRFRQKYTLRPEISECFLGASHIMLHYRTGLKPKVGFMGVDKLSIANQSPVCTKHGDYKKTPPSSGRLQIVKNNQ